MDNPTHKIAAEEVRNKSATEVICRQKRKLQLRHDSWACIKNKLVEVGVAFSKHAFVFGLCTPMSQGEAAVSDCSGARTNAGQART